MGWGLGGIESVESFISSFAVPSATVIEAGDICWFDDSGAVALPASSVFWDFDLETTQGTLTALFLGIALQGSPNGNVGPINVSMNPLKIWEFETEEDDYVFGQTLSVTEDPNNTLSNKVLVAAESSVGIAKAMETKENATVLKVAFASAFGLASSNENSHIG